MVGIDKVGKVEKMKSSKDRVLREKTGNQVTLAGDMETNGSGNFLGSVKVILMRTPSNGK